MHKSWKQWTFATTWQIKLQIILAWKNDLPVILSTIYIKNINGKVRKPNRIFHAQVVTNNDCCYLHIATINYSWLSKQKYIMASTNTSYFKLYIYSLNIIIIIFLRNLIVVELSKYTSNQQKWLFRNIINLAVTRQK